MEKTLRTVVRCEKTKAVKTIKMTMQIATSKDQNVPLFSKHGAPSVMSASAEAITENVTWKFIC